MGPNRGTKPLAGGVKWFGLELVFMVNYSKNKFVPRIGPSDWSLHLVPPFGPSPVSVPFPFGPSCFFLVPVVPGSSPCQQPLSAALVSSPCQQPLPAALASSPCQQPLSAALVKKDSTEKHKNNRKIIGPSHFCVSRKL